MTESPPTSIADPERGAPTGAGRWAGLSRPGWMGLLLAAVTLAVFAWPLARCDFLNYDDPYYVTANAHVRAGLTWSGVGWAFRAVEPANWHPLTWLSHLLDVTLFGLAPAGAHLMNLLLHAANTVLLFAVLRRLTAAHWRSAMVAALFALHPLHVESVAWIAERKDVLSTLFWLLTLLLYARYARKLGTSCVSSGPSVGTSCVSSEPIEMHGRHAGRPYQGPNQVGTSCVSSGGAAAQPYPGMAPTRRSALPGWPRRSAALPDYCSAALPDRHGSALDYWLAWLFFALGLMSKPMLVTLPFVLLLLDYWPLGRFSAGTGSGNALAELPTVHDPGGAGLAGPDARQRVPTTTTDATPVLRSSTAEGGQRGPTGSDATQRVPTRTADTQVGPTEIDHPASGIEHPLSRLRLLVWEKWPFFVLSAVSCVVTFLAQRNSGAVLTLTNIPLKMRVENVFVSYARYLGKLFWPTGLALPYPYPDAWPTTVVAGSAALCVGLCVAAWRLGGRWPFLRTGWFWFLGTLIPVIGLVQVGSQSLADRYTYVPSIGIFIILSWGAEVIIRTRRPSSVAVLRRVDSASLPIAWGAGIVAILILGVLAARTVDQLRYWRNSGTLFRHTIACTRNNGLAYDNLGYWLLTQGRVDEAMASYGMAAQLNARDPIAQDGLGCCCFSRGQRDEAIKRFQRALEISPNQATSLFNLGSALAEQQQFTQAINYFRTALRLEPENPDAHLSMGNVFLRQKRFAEAIEGYQAALRVAPDYVKAHLCLGAIFAELGRVDEAIHHYQEALRLAPDDVPTRITLAAMLRSHGRPDEAVRLLREGLRLQPDDAALKEALGGAGGSTAK